LVVFLCREASRLKGDDKTLFTASEPTVIKW
jgi:hypothetical protein